jgi:hypothetical protein
MFKERISGAFRKLEIAWHKSEQEREAIGDIARHPKEKRVYRDAMREDKASKNK